MLSKTLFIAFAAVASVARAATPPGCLLGAVNTYEDPANIKSVCSDKEATSKIAKYCGDATKDALSSFAELCKNAGVTVDTTLPTSTGSSSPTGTSATRPTGSSGINPATTGSTATGAAANQPTNSNVPGAAGKVDVGVAALLAGLGIMAVAL